MFSFSIQLAFDDVLSQLEKERMQEEAPSRLTPGETSSGGVRTAADGGGVGVSADLHQSVQDDSLHAINKDTLIDAVRRSVLLSSQTFLSFSYLSMNSCKEVAKGFCYSHM